MLALRLTEPTRVGTSISASCAIGDLRFHTTVWYADIDLDELAAQHGADRLAHVG